MKRSHSIATSGGAASDEGEEVRDGTRTSSDGGGVADSTTESPVNNQPTERQVRRARKSSLLKAFIAESTEVLPPSVSLSMVPEDLGIAQALRAALPGPDVPPLYVRNVGLSGQLQHVMNSWLPHDGEQEDAPKGDKETQQVDGAAGSAESSSGDEPPLPHLRPMHLDNGTYCACDADTPQPQQDALALASSPALVYMSPDTSPHTVTEAVVSPITAAHATINLAAQEAAAFLDGPNRSQWGIRGLPTGQQRPWAWLSREWAPSYMDLGAWLGDDLAEQAERAMADATRAGHTLVQLPTPFPAVLGVGGPNDNQLRLFAQGTRTGWSLRRRWTPLHYRRIDALAVAARDGRDETNGSILAAIVGEALRISSIHWSDDRTEEESEEERERERERDEAGGGGAADDDEDEEDGLPYRLLHVPLFDAPPVAQAPVRSICWNDQSVAGTFLANELIVGQGDTVRLYDVAAGRDGEARVSPVGERVSLVSASTHPRVALATLGLDRRLVTVDWRAATVAVDGDAYGAAGRHTQAIATPASLFRVLTASHRLITVWDERWTKEPLMQWDRQQPFDRADANAALEPPSLLSHVAGPEHSWIFCGEVRRPHLAVGYATRGVGERMYEREDTSTPVRAWATKRLPATHRIDALSTFQSAVHGEREDSGGLLSPDADSIRSALILDAADAADSHQLLELSRFGDLYARRVFWSAQASAAEPLLRRPRPTGGTLDIPTPAQAERAASLEQAGAYVPPGPLGKARRRENNPARPPKATKKVSLWDPSSFPRHLSSVQLALDADATAADLHASAFALPSELTESQRERTASITAIALEYLPRILLDMRGSGTMLELAAMVLRGVGEDGRGVHIPTLLGGVADAAATRNDVHLIDLREKDYETVEELEADLDRESLAQRDARVGARGVVGDTPPGEKLDPRVLPLANWAKTFIFQCVTPDGTDVTHAECFASIALPDAHEVAEKDREEEEEEEEDEEEEEEEAAGGGGGGTGGSSGLGSSQNVFADALAFLSQRSQDVGKVLTAEDEREFEGEAPIDFSRFMHPVSREDAIPRAEIIDFLMKLFQPARPC
jgi:hypothetical protein